MAPTYGSGIGPNPPPDAPHVGSMPVYFGAGPSSARPVPAVGQRGRYMDLTIGRMIFWGGTLNPHWYLDDGTQVADFGLGISGAPNGATVGTAYSFTPSVSGGTPTYTFALTGSLLAGLSFSTSTGAISGTPTATGTASNLSITVTDSKGATAVLGPFSITAAASGGGGGGGTLAYRADSTSFSADNSNFTIDKAA